MQACERDDKTCMCRSLVFSLWQRPSYQHGLDACRSAGWLFTTRSLHVFDVVLCCVFYMYAHVIILVFKSPGRHALHPRL